MTTKLDRARARYWTTRAKYIAACKACHLAGDAEHLLLQLEEDRALDDWAEAEARYDELRLAVGRAQAPRSYPASGESGSRGRG